MKKMSTLILAAVTATTYCACSSQPDEAALGEKIVGIYAKEGEHEFDHFRDTLEVKSNDDGKFDIVTFRWSSAKKDDPQRPVNKVAGQWNKGRISTTVAELQASDTTLRITEPLTGEVSIISVDLEKGTLERQLRNGENSVYQRVSE